MKIKFNDFGRCLICLKNPCQCSERKTKEYTCSISNCTNQPDDGERVCRKCKGEAKDKIVLKCEDCVANYSCDKEESTKRECEEHQNNHNRLKDFAVRCNSLREELDKLKAEIAIKDKALDGILHDYCMLKCWKPEDNIPKLKESYLNLAKSIILQNKLGES